MRGPFFGEFVCELCARTFVAATTRYLGVRAGGSVCEECGERSQSRAEKGGPNKDELRAAA
jgi:transcription elongation factor Elf1